MTNFSFCCSRTWPATILSISRPLLLCSPLPGLGEVSWGFHLFLQTPSYITLAAWGSYTAGCHGNLMTGFLSYYGVENETVSVICCDISPKVSSRLWGAESLHSIQTNLIFFLFAREKMKCFLSYSVQPQYHKERVKDLWLGLCYQATGRNKKCIISIASNHCTSSIAWRLKRQNHKMKYSRLKLASCMKRFRNQCSKIYMVHTCSPKYAQGLVE